MQFYILKLGVCHIKYHDIQIISRFTCPTMLWLFSNHHQAIKSLLPNLHHISQPCTEALRAVVCFKKAKVLFCDSVILGIKFSCPNAASGVTLGAVGYPAAAPEQCSSPASKAWYNAGFLPVISRFSIRSHLTKPGLYQRQNTIN